MLDLDTTNQLANQVTQTQINTYKRKAHLHAIAGNYTKAIAIAEKLYQVTKKQEYKNFQAIWQKHQQKHQKDNFIGELVPIAGNCFAAGSSHFDKQHKKNEKQHNRCVSDFVIAKHEVTVNQFKRFCQETDCAMNQFIQAQGVSKPITRVSWQQVLAYIDWINTKTNQTFSLPTDYEWEYAATGGYLDGRKYYWGKKMEVGFANCADCGSEWGSLSAAAVGSFKPNNWELHDMLGNVWEWTCTDYIGDYDLQSDACSNNPQLPKSIRGGSWLSNNQDTRISSRYSLPSTTKTDDLGFRLVRRLVNQKAN